MSKLFKVLGVLSLILGTVLASVLLVAVFFAAWSLGFAAVAFVTNALLHYVGGVHYLGLYKTLAVGALCNVARIAKGMLFG